MLGPTRGEIQTAFSFNLRAPATPAPPLSRPVAGRTLGAGSQQVPLGLRGLVPGACHCTVREGRCRRSPLVVVEEGQWAASGLNS
ncbi:MAG TPA: hypothetical protein VFO93_12260 [Hymenobacter sp.]|nr:hypothetical protein [Hymenobacter sp.]